jgi:hypothetical protein
MRVRLLGFMVMMAFLPTLCHARVFFAGSNPSMTVFAYPQDLWLMPHDYAFWQTTWQVQPWWGDIDQPDLRPSPTYLLTGEKIGVKGSGAYFEHDANLYNWKNIAGVCREISPTLKLRFDLDYTFMPMRSEAQGEAGPVSFNYKEGHSIQDIYLTTYAATLWKSIPLGFKFGLGRQASNEPDLEWSVNNGGTVTQLQRLMWGWSTLQGGSVFDVEHAHARYQDEYTVGSQYHFDLQAAATLPRLKFGGRLRYSTGALDCYEWHANNPGDYEDLTGAYTNDLTKEISERTIRVYGNYNWIDGGWYKFSTLTLSRFTMNDSDDVDPRNNAVSQGRRNIARTFVFQTNPNISLYPWKYKNTFIDLALLCNYSYTHYSHLQQYGVDGGQKESCIGTSVDTAGDIEDYAWNDFSYAHSQFFEIAFDANPCFPVYGDEKQSVAVNLLLLLWTRFKLTAKYYGQSVADGADLKFNVANVRHNFDHETWLNSVVNLIYRRGSTMYRLTIGQPLIYSLKPETRIYDANDSRMISELLHQNMWVSQAGMSLGFFITTPIDNVPLIRSIPWGKKNE